MDIAIARTPIGDISIFAEGDVIVALEYGRGETLNFQGKTHHNPLLNEACSQLDAYFLARRKTFDLPLSPEGTPFQKRVWDAMADIPFGQTLTYGELARRVGSGARAIGGACKYNPIPIFIPCHRVVSQTAQRTQNSDTVSLGGYSFGSGIETKKYLLHLEGAGVINA